MVEFDNKRISSINTVILQWSAISTMSEKLIGISDLMTRIGFAVARKLWFNSLLFIYCACDAGLAHYKRKQVFCCR